ncbi:hypothetical protein HRI_000466400 [Hibiscus trionum]|uniref:non-specific serine/threonine protein kinase n=1 Tax=Hibiscus trionum TaxID=183268 RepID=A0A9W7LL23_HIBTR|nr:hypothetical protein HRI_000466400 [Hibiscus trionum]
MSDGAIVLEVGCFARILVGFFRMEFTAWIRCNLQSVYVFAPTIVNWPLFFRALLWLIWKERNRLVFTPEVTWSVPIVERCRNVVQECEQARLMHSRLGTTIAPVCMGSEQWMAPSPRWVKINSDGARVQADGWTACGALDNNNMAVEEMVNAEKESPRGVLENPGVESDSDSSLICPAKPIPSQKNINLDFNGLPWKQMIGSIKKKTPVISFSIFPMVPSYEISRKSLIKKITKLYGTEVDDDCLSPVIPSCKNFAYSDLAAATDNFSPKNLLGEGGSAEVYKGKLSDGRIVAVKKFIKNEKENEETSTDLLSELGILTHISHPNAAHLIGYSIDSGVILVLEFSPHGSLASLLFGSDEGLDWNRRFKVALGVAEGLKYLHHDCPRRIIHRDIKAANILLTEDYEAQISDFGLAKWLPDNCQQHVVYPIEGTLGYLAPEYFMHGIVDEKTDVFAFGVLLLEILTGRRAVDTLSRQSLVIWAKPLLEVDDVKQLVDPRLEDSYDPTEMKHAMLTASLCINHLASCRPSMKKVIELLNGEEQGPSEYEPKSYGEAIIIDNCEAQAYSRTSYQNDLNRHMQLLME